MWRAIDKDTYIVEYIRNILYMFSGSVRKITLQLSRYRQNLYSNTRKAK